MCASQLAPEQQNDQTPWGLFLPAGVAGQKRGLLIRDFRQMAEIMRLLETALLL